MTASRLTAPAKLSGPVTVLTVTGVLLLFCVPPSLLDLVGFNYGTPEGAAWEKVHPGTDLLVLAAALAALRSGNPLRWVIGKFRRFPGVAIHLATIVLLIVYLVKVQQAPFTPVIDTFIMPAVLFFLLVDLSRRGEAALETGLHIFLAVNAVLGIIEYLTGWRLIPVILHGSAITAEIEWRAFGLLGHPLSSAAMAGLYAIVLGLGFGRRLPHALRFSAMALQLIALGAFGGRTALVLTLGFFIVLIVKQLFGILAGQRLGRRSLTLAVLASPILVAGVAALVSSGFFDQLMDRFVDDKGSAKSREIIFHLFSYLSWQEILLGPDQTHIDTIQHLEGIEVGVESFWIGYVILTGLWMSSFVFIGLGLFMTHVLARCDRLALVPLVFFVLIISTSISLSVKSAQLAEFIVLVSVMMPAAPQLAPARGRQPLLVPI